MSLPGQLCYTVPGFVWLPSALSLWLVPTLGPEQMVATLASGFEVGTAVSLTEHNSDVVGITASGIGKWGVCGPQG